MSTRYTWSLGRKLDTERMKAAAEILRGEHDFRGFTARRNDGSDETLDPVRNLYRLDVSRKGNKIEIIAEADGFLYKMVRSLVGALVEVGLAKLSTEQVQEILISGKRGNLIQSAPAHGLFLEKVFYEKNTSSNDATISRHIPGNGSAHLDIFIDTGARDLATFEAPNNSWETLSSGNATTVSPKTAHRKRYLNFEGELSDQRGSVAILWKGKWKGIQPSPDEPLTLKMESGRLNVTAAATPSS